MSLILWLYCRTGQPTAGCAIPSLMVSYLYLIYAFARKNPATAWFELSLLAALNGFALRTRLSCDALAGALALRNATLEKLAAIDELTALYCRRQIFDLGHREFSRCSRGGEPLCVLLLDVDRFKDINDRLGHAGGDRTLQNLGEILRDSLRTQDLVGRYGADVFLALLPDTGLAGAELTADRLRRAINSRPIIHDSRKITLTVSMGIAVLDSQIEDFQGLVHRADVALYEAKRRGGDQFRSWFSLDDHRSARDRRLGNLRASSELP
ncbi:MAG: GGDEF domain-containing protein [Gammaproteobacteria bacterium]|nr:GGDEF domain-containing protein [Gammaproteobacteria bacterium]